MEDPEREGMRSERNEWQSQPAQNWKLKRKDNEGRKGGTRTKRNGNPGIADGSLILLFYTAKISARPSYQSFACYRVSLLIPFAVKFPMIDTNAYLFFSILASQRYKYLSSLIDNRLKFQTVGSCCVVDQKTGGYYV